MTHIADDDLIAYALDDVESGARAGMELHLEGCATCRAALHEIEAALALASAADVPERGDEYGAAVWERLAPRLDGLPSAGRGAETPPARRGVRNLTMLRAAAAALVLAGGAYWLGRQTAPAPAPVEIARETTTPATGAIRERVVLAALGEHLDRTERTLVEFVNASADGRVDISAEQAWARELLEANRLYRQAARGADAPALSQVLEDLEPVLLELANSPGRLSSEEFRALRERIEARSLVFKVRVTGADVRARQRALLRPGEL